MKKLIFLLLLIFVSCAEMKALMSEDTQNVPNRRTYFSDTNKEMITVKINNEPYQMLFDTGAGATVLYRAKFPIDAKKKFRERSVVGFDHKTSVKAFNYSADTVSAEVFKTRHKYLYMTEPRKNACDSTNTMDGILSNFYESDLIMELNYEKGYVEFLTAPDVKDWIQLPAKFNETTGKFYVELDVYGVKDFFLFDTGNKTMTYLNQEVFHNQSQKSYTIEMLGKAVGNSTISLKLDVYPAHFSLGSLGFDTAACIDLTSNRSVLSKSFIEHFNWRFDKKNKRAYCIPINPESLIKPKQLRKTDRLLTAVIDDKLLVSYKNFETAVEVGDQIISVGNETVTRQNVCEFSKLLNESKDWQSLRLTYAVKN